MCLIFSFFHEGICQATGRRGGLLLQYQEKFGILSLKTKRARRCKISQVKKKKPIDFYPRTKIMVIIWN